VDAESKRVTFDTKLTATGNNTGIVVPAELLDELGSGKRPPVLVDVNGYQYRNTVGSMGGRYMISVSAAVREATGLKGGDPVRVTLTVADEPRSIKVPPDLDAAFTSNETARAFFDTLSNSLQRYHIDTINGAKSADTRQRRIDKAIGLFLEGKRR
jgi:bifunctional DNA-binding transcriptional regulator/antitoxin component of YhaV-PrlF toxin-antitoxin module